MCSAGKMLTSGNLGNQGELITEGQQVCECVSDVARWKRKEMKKKNSPLSESEMKVDIWVTAEMSTPDSVGNKMD